MLKHLCRDRPLQHWIFMLLATLSAAALTLQQPTTRRALIGGAAVTATIATTATANDVTTTIAKTTAANVEPSIRRVYVAGATGRTGIRVMEELQKTWQEMKDLKTQVNTAEDRSEKVAKKAGGEAGRGTVKTANTSH